MKLNLTLLFTALSLSLNAKAAMYAVTDLGAAPGSNSSYGYGLSSNGWATGQGFVYRDGKMTGLEGTGYGINASGQVTGGTVSVGGPDPGLPDSYSSAFLYSQGQYTTIGAGAGSGINDKGQITGTAIYPQKSGYPPNAFLYQNGHTTDLFFLGANESYGYAINSAGQIVGSARLADGGHAVLYSNGQETDLGALLGLKNSSATAINDQGQIAGDFFSNDNTWHGFIYGNGQVTELNPLKAGDNINVLGINDQGQAVGKDFKDLSDLAHSAAFLYSNGRTVDLNTLIAADAGVNLFEAQAINDNGLILANGTTAQGQTHAFILTPTAVPVPAAVWLFGSALAGFGRLARRRRTA